MATKHSSADNIPEPRQPVRDVPGDAPEPFKPKRPAKLDIPERFLTGGATAEERDEWLKANRPDLLPWVGVTTTEAHQEWVKADKAAKDAAAKAATQPASPAPPEKAEITHPVPKGTTKLTDPKDPWPAKSAKDWGEDYEPKC